MRHKVLGNCLIVIGALFLLFSTWFVLNVWADAYRASKTMEELKAALYQQYALPADGHEMSPFSVKGDRGNSLMNDSFPSLSSDKYIGFLLIPSLELSLAVQSKWGNTMLKDAPCCYAGTIEGKNIIIAGHNYQSHFGRLKYLNIGDTVSLVTLEGTEYLYAISDIEVLGSTDLEEMKTGDWDLTLFTCTTRGTQRLTIRCVSQ